MADEIRRKSSKRARVNRKVILQKKRFRNQQYTSDTINGQQKRLNGKTSGKHTIIATDNQNGNPTSPKRKFFHPWILDEPKCKCDYCGAIMWYEERADKKIKTTNPKFSLCCQQGRVKLPHLKHPPDLLQQLIYGTKTPKSAELKDNIRGYNSVLAFTSTGAKVHTEINNGTGPYVYKISGGNYHKIGSLIPQEGQTPKFAQLYIYDTQNEVENRIKALQKNKQKKKLDKELLQKLIEMLDKSNPIAQAFRMARDRCENQQTADVSIRLLSKRKRDARQYNLPTSSEVAALVVGDFSTSQNGRDIIVHHKRRGLQQISELHPSFMAMQYPLLFPYGEDGFQENIPYNTGPNIKKIKRGYVTMREYYAYRMQDRLQEGKTLMSGGRLLQQYSVDALSCVIDYRLCWIKNHQTQLRSDIKKGLHDALTNGETTAASTGKRVILPASFTGGPRYMIQNFHDAMAICKWIGHPELFITFTCNPKWPEIQKRISTTTGGRPEDRPDIIARVFKIKLEELMTDIRKNNHFGRVLAAVYTIEYQKRGLPHAHILIWLHPDDKIKQIEDIDKYISAEIPDPEKDPIGYAAVTEFMIHGPCGSANPDSPCMNQETKSCTKHFPKPYSNETTLDDNGYPRYRRRQTPDTNVQINGLKLDNRYVVPHNLDLVIKYQAHINVELCNKSKSMKYLFKYITKGEDRTVAILTVDTNSTNSTENTQQNNSPKVDEIQSYLDCRYLSAIESCWRIFDFDIHYRYPGIERLTFHLPDEQIVYYNDNDRLKGVVNRPNIDKTMFTEWMLSNRRYPEGHNLTYSEYPIKFVWNTDTKEWTLRKKGKCIGRLYSAHPSQGEKYYLRMLLNVVRGPCSYQDIRSFNGIVHTNFKDACYARGFLDDEKEWIECMNEAAHWASPQELRNLFITILLFCEIPRAAKLWDSSWKHMAEDIVYRQRKLMHTPNLELSEEQTKNYLLCELQKILQKRGSSLKEFKDMPYPTMTTDQNSTNRLILEETNYNRQTLQKEHEELFRKLNNGQLGAYKQILESVDKNFGNLFFVQGHGGTGKTFLWRTICAKIRSQGKIVLAVGSSGIASLLLPGGVTAHSRFKIPLSLNENSVCEIKQGSHLAELIKKASLIIWDEAPMTHRFAFEAVDRTLRDIRRSIDDEASKKPFGGITVALGGDFRQILPVVTKGSRGDIVNASINRSEIWKSCQVCKLHDNMRLNDASLNAHDKQELTKFSKWILQIGDGKAPAIPSEEEDEPTWVTIPKDILLESCTNDIETIAESTYPEFSTRCFDEQYLQERAILCPLNDTVDAINDYMLEHLPGEKKTFYSSDSICRGTGCSADHEELYPLEYLNSLKFPNIPNHELQLKVGATVMLLRNINQTMGLCNGTRLIITQLANWVVEAKIITGRNSGSKVLIPRIIMSPSDVKLPFLLRRRQFPLKLCFAMTINKSQGQTLQNVGLYLNQPVFTHGQLYVAISRVTNRKGIKILAQSNNRETRPHKKHSLL